MLCSYLRSLICLGLVGLLAGCGSGPDVVSLAPELTELTVALGQGARLSGVSAKDDYPAQVLDLPRVGTSEAPDFAVLATLKPKLILTTVAPAALREFAAANGAQVVEANAPRLDTLGETITAVGAALGAAEAAAPLVASLDTERQTLASKLADKARPKVLIVTGRPASGVDRVQVAGSDSLAADLVALAAGDNAFADTPGASLEVSLEEIKARAPEVILELHPGMSLTDNQRQDLYGTWNAAPELPALTRGTIFFVTDTHCLRPGPRVIESAALIAKTMHGNFEWDLAQSGE